MTRSMRWWPVERVRVLLMTVAVAAGGLAPVASRAQTGRERIVGTWTLVSEVAHVGSKTTEPLGSNPLGTIMLDGGGRFSLMIARAGLPAFAAGRREAGTPAENKAVLAGALAFFGTYALEEGTLTLRPEASTFPNWVGAAQKRTCVITGNEMRWTNRSPAIGADFVELVWRRAG